MRICKEHRLGISEGYEIIVTAGINRDKEEDPVSFSRLIISAFIQLPCLGKRGKLHGIFMRNTKINTFLLKKKV